MTSRRAFVAGALSLLGVPLDAETQTARKVPSIGYLCTYPCGGPRYQAFVDSLEALEGALCLLRFRRGTESGDEERRNVARSS